MKSFLEEYGFAILAAIVVIILILMISPFGKVIKSSLTGVVNGFSETTVDSIHSADAKFDSIFDDSNEGGGEYDPNRTCHDFICEGQLYLLTTPNGTFYAHITDVGDDSLSYEYNFYLSEAGDIFEPIDEYMTFDYLNNMLAVSTFDLIQESYSGLVTNRSYFVPFEPRDVFELNGHTYLIYSYENGIIEYAEGEYSNGVIRGDGCGTEELDLHDYVYGSLTKVAKGVTDNISLCRVLVEGDLILINGDLAYVKVVNSSLGKYEAFAATYDSQRDVYIYYNCQIYVYFDDYLSEGYHYYGHADNAEIDYGGCDIG